MKLVSKRIALILTVVMCMLAVGNSMAYATSVGNNAGNGLSVIPLNDESYLLVDVNGSAIMEMENENDLFTVSVTNEAGENNYFVVNTQTNTLYSSVTGKTLQRSDLIENGDTLTVEKDSFIKEEDATTMGTTHVSSTYVNVNYKKLADVVGAISEAYTIAAGIISVAALIMGVSIATGPATVVTLIGVGMTVIIKYLKSPTTAKGATVKIDKMKISKIQAGQTFYSYKYVIDDVTLY